MAQGNGRKIFVNLAVHDPDGHHWEVLWMDPGAIEKPAGSSAQA